MACAVVLVLAAPVRAEDDLGKSPLEQVMEDGELDANDRHVVHLVDWLLQYAFEQRASDMTFPVSGEDAPQPFPVDIVPRVVHAETWTTLSRGLAQRAKALDAFLHDVYGDREVVADGMVPAWVIDGAPGLLPLATLIDQPVRAHVCGMDLVHDVSGTWYVLEDNLRVPSGLGYAMANRWLTEHIWPDLDVPDDRIDLELWAEEYLADVDHVLLYDPALDGIGDEITDHQYGFGRMDYEGMFAVLNEHNDAHTGAPHPLAALCMTATEWGRRTAPATCRRVGERRGDAGLLPDLQQRLQQFVQRRDQSLQFRHHQEAGVDVGKLVRLALVVAEQQLPRGAQDRPGDAPAPPRGDAPQRMQDLRRRVLARQGHAELILLPGGIGGIFEVLQGAAAANPEMDAAGQRTARRSFQDSTHGPDLESGLRPMDRHRDVLTGQRTFDEYGFAFAMRDAPTFLVERFDELVERADAPERRTRAVGRAEPEQLAELAACADPGPARRAPELRPPRDGRTRVAGRAVP